MEQYWGREYLKNRLMLKRSRVLLRYKYYEMKNGISYFRSIIPREFLWMAETLGWCAKAVEDRLIVIPVIAFKILPMHITTK